MIIQELMERHHLTDVQLNREIGDDDIPPLADYFDKVKLYLDLMELSSADKQNVLHNLNDTQIAMSQCLSLWKRHDPSKATYIALLEIILKLRAGKTADNVCRYLAAKNGGLIL